MERERNDRDLGLARPKQFLKYVSGAARPLKPAGEAFRTDGTGTEPPRWQNHKIYVKWMDRFFTYLVPQRAQAWEKQGLSLYVGKSSEVPLNSLYPHEIFFVRYSNNMSQLVADRARQLPTGTSPSSRIATTSSCSRRRI